MTPNQRIQPLSGYTVIELGSTVAGPFCGRLLADFGATVIKVEVAEGDALRSMGSHKDGVSLYALSMFRNKELISVDLRTEEGQSLLRQLINKADFVVENFRPGTMERWGLAYESLSASNPGLIMVRISGYGQDGPYSLQPGYGVIGEAISGLRSITGDPDRPPARVATSLSDYLTGLYGAFGALLALEARHRTGRGQVVDTALAECAFSFMEPHVMAYDQLGVIAQRAGSQLPGSSPNNLYQAGDGCYIHVAALADPIFRRLCVAMGQPELANEPRYASNMMRSQHSDEVDAVVQCWIGARTYHEIHQVLGDHDIPHAKIYNIDDVFADPHFAARGSIQRRPHERVGMVAVPNVTPRLTETPGEVRELGRDTGADTATVLARMLGLTSEAVSTLQRRGVIYDPALAH
ncbi:CoA transferase (plasmid) [Cupriavidus sp. P-10]|uniref:CaiB/BaiF CoA transferase family protein n=1 Tax=Cupriavidus sp. P-10 TaxID=2027911 RepID=UPI000E2FBF27|nr:CaiB/BaiF CoA-transferase family protein [Cupriavidus sp. P-10]BDB30687.1 CoA transferase [Cupriavidus sp. P-10]